MLTELCAELKNYFLRNREGDIHTGTFSIENGSIEELPFLNSGQFFRIVGSVFNDGVYQYPTSELEDEVFDGAIWAMAVPPSVVALAAEITQWLGNEDNQKIVNSPYSSESFGGYSYSKATGADGSSFTWKDQFANRLKMYRRLSVL